MTLGIQGTPKNTLVYKIFEDVTSAHPDPSGDVAHFKFTAIKNRSVNFNPEDQALIRLWSTAGTAPFTLKGRVWARNTTGGSIWVPCGIDPIEANKGLLNEANAITGAVTLRHQEPFELTELFDEFYVQLFALGGNDYHISGELVFEKQAR